MEQILSQEEIDALLKGISEGEIETQKEVVVEEQIETKPFDFIQYTRGKKERLPALDFTTTDFRNLSGLPYHYLWRKKSK
jgi:flagellar motor switch protein FliM